MDNTSKPLKETLPGEDVDLDLMNVILRIPKEAVFLEITAGVLDEDGEVKQVSSKLSVSGIRDARQAFLDNVEDGDEYDTKYVIMEEGRRYLEQLKKQGGDECE